MMQLKLTLNNGIKMPVLGFGTWQLTDFTVEKALATALETGYRSVDTAAIYGNERGVGRAVKSSGLAREHVFVTTKVLDREGYAHTVDCFRASLDRLDMGYVDLCLIHWPFDAAAIETWRALEDLYTDGLVRAIGVSNYSVGQLDKLIRNTRVSPAVNQVELHPRLAQLEMRRYCAAAGIAVESWSPLTEGRRLLNHPVVVKIAQAQDRTAAQILLRWQIQHQLIVIPRSSNPNHIRTNANIFDFELSSADMHALDSLNENRRISPIADPETFNFTEEAYRHLLASSD